MEVKKSEKANLENYRGIFILAGLIVSLLLVYFILAYSVKSVKIEDLEGQMEANVEEEQIPITEQKIEQPPPPPQKTQMSEVIEVVDDKTKLEDIFDFSSEVDEEENMEFEEVNIDEGDEEETETEKIFQVYEISQKPEFPGGDVALRRYIAEHIEYPELAIENEIEGTVYVRFVVLENGAVGKVELVRGVDPLLDEEAMRVVKTLPKFKPGMQGGHPVKVWYLVPIQFKLQR